jgi:hypothetical protein
MQSNPRCLQKAAVVIQECALLRLLDRSVLETAFQTSQRKKELFDAVKSLKQKRAPEIQLMAFSDGGGRSDGALRTGWQSLDVPDDSFASGIT